MSLPGNTAAVQGEAFYEQLPLMKEFQELFSLEHYVPLPDGWSVIVTDIRGSAEAVRRGAYKNVNTVGVSSIIAVVNAVRPLGIPYAFGGDGATLCVPDSRLTAVRRALAAVRMLAKNKFGLDLRVGIVPIALLREEGQRMLVAKYRVSEGYTQAMFGGGGVSRAEALVKGEGGEERFGLTEEDKARAAADFTGFECRWKSIASPYGETVSLLVAAHAGTGEETSGIYRAVMAEIVRIYGEKEVFCPVQEQLLELSTDKNCLSDEVSVRTAFQGRHYRYWYGATLPLLTRLGNFFMRRGIRAAGVDWGGYKKALVANTDFHKFDDLLRLVMAGTAAQRAELTAWLEGKRAKGTLHYGLFSSPAALMTCMISDYARDHVHFVDGSDGGYAMAALELKSQMSNG